MSYKDLQQIVIKMQEEKITITIENNKSQSQLNWNIVLNKSQREGGGVLTSSRIDSSNECSDKFI